LRIRGNGGGGVDRKRWVSFASSVWPSSTSTFLHAVVLGSRGVAGQLSLGARIGTLRECDSGGSGDCDGCRALDKSRGVVAFHSVRGNNDNDRRCVNRVLLVVMRFVRWLGRSDGDVFGLVRVMMMARGMDWLGVRL